MDKIDSQLSTLVQLIASSHGSLGKTEELSPLPDADDLPTPLPIQAVLAASMWEIGDRVKVLKEGSQTGNSAVVTELNWANSGRVKVKMEQLN